MDRCAWAAKGWRRLIGIKVNLRSTRILSLRDQARRPNRVRAPANGQTVPVSGVRGLALVVVEAKVVRSKVRGAPSRIAPAFARKTALGGAAPSFMRDCRGSEAASEMRHPAGDHGWASKRSEALAVFRHARKRRPFGHRKKIFGARREGVER